MSSLPAWLVPQVSLQPLLLELLHCAGGSKPTGDGTGICHTLCREERGADTHSSFNNKTALSSQVYLYFSEVKALAYSDKANSEGSLV